MSDPVNSPSSPLPPPPPTHKKFAFPKWANYLLPIILLTLLGTVTVVVPVVLFGLSPETLATNYQPDQPVPYSHARHLAMGLDCKTCHNTVMESNFASIPSAEVCIRCHAPKSDASTQQVHATSPLLKPLHDAWASGRPVRWVKVHDLPSFAYFSHAAHTNRGVGCASCHGRIDKMGGSGTAEPVAGVTQIKNLSMAWCLECHRAPEKNLRPLSQITNMEWQAPAKAGETPQEAQLRQGLELKAAYGIRSKAYMQACSTCHR